MDCVLEYAPEISNDWFHKWSDAPDRYRIYEHVKGPFPKPKLVLSIPYIDKTQVCQKSDGKLYSRTGIPDPWQEYLILRESKEKGKGGYEDYRKHDHDVMKSLRRNYNLYFGSANPYRESHTSCQGIPDPWKKWTRLEREETKSSYHTFKKALQKHFENLKSGPGRSMYDTDRVSCPNCDQDFLVLSVDEPREDEEGNGGREETTPKAIESRQNMKRDHLGIFEHKIFVKDAEVETENATLTRSDKATEVRGLDWERSCQCGRYGVNQVSRHSLPVTERERGRRTVCRCGRDASPGTNPFVYLVPHVHHFGGVPPPEPSFKCSHFDHEYLCCPNFRLNHPRSVLPYFLNNSGSWSYFPPHLIGLEEKTPKHSLELRLTCPTCDRRHDRRRRRDKKRSSRKESHNLETPLKKDGQQGFSSWKCKGSLTCDGVRARCGGLEEFYSCGKYGSPKTPFKCNLKEDTFNLNTKKESNTTFAKDENRFPWLHTSRFSGVKYDFNQFKAKDSTNELIIKRGETGNGRWEAKPYGLREKSISTLMNAKYGDLALRDKLRRSDPVSELKTRMDLFGKVSKPFSDDDRRPLLGWKPSAGGSVPMQRQIFGKKNRILNRRTGELEKLSEVS